MRNMANTSKAAAPRAAKTIAPPPKKATRPAAKTAPAKKAGTPTKQVIPGPVADAVFTPPPPAPRARTRALAGWYVDTDDPTLMRYWDGDAWLGGPIPAPTTADPTTSGDDEDDDEDQAAAAAGPSTILFNGRTMAVRDVTAEQISVWQRIAEQLQAVNAAPPGEETADESQARKRRTAKALHRALKVIMSVLVHETDQEWVEDEMMAGHLTLEKAAEIVSLAVDAFTTKHEGAPNRAARRAAAPPKARRRR